jgi:hypothetical protein
MDVAQPLPRVYLETTQEMVAILHLLTPCCTLVAPCLGWDPYPIRTSGLFPPFTSRFAAPPALHAPDAVCGRLSLPPQAANMSIMGLVWSLRVYHPEFRKAASNFATAPLDAAASC